MDPVEEDAFDDAKLEIYDRIEEEHRRGGHVTGRVAGCNLCAQQYSATAHPSPAAVTPEAIARLRVIDSPPTVTATNPETEALGRMAAKATAYVPPRHTPPVYGGEESLGDVALQDAQGALDRLNMIHGREHALSAIAEGLVGAVRALAGIERQLQFIAATLAYNRDSELEQLGAAVGRDAGELDAERPIRPEVRDAEPDGEP